MNEDSLATKDDQDALEYRVKQLHSVRTRLMAYRKKDSQAWSDVLHVIPSELYIELFCMPGFDAQKLWRQFVKNAIVALEIKIEEAESDVDNARWLKERATKKSAQGQAEDRADTQ